MTPNRQLEVARKLLGKVKLEPEAGIFVTSPFPLRFLCVTWRLDVDVGAIRVYGGQSWDPGGWWGLDVFPDLSHPSTVGWLLRQALVRFELRGDFSFEYGLYDGEFRATVRTGGKFVVEDECPGVALAQALIQREADA